MEKKLGIIIDGDYNAFIVNRFEKIHSEQVIYCIFLTTKKFYEKSCRNVVAISYNNFSSVANDISTIYFSNEVDPKEKELIKQSYDKKFYDLRPSFNLIIDKLSCEDSTDKSMHTMHALTILLIGLAPESENFPIQHKIYDELKDDYRIEFLSSDKFAQVLDIETIDFGLLKKSNYPSLILRQKMRSIASTHGIDKDIFLYDFPYSVGASEILCEESIDILFRDLISAIVPDFVIYSLPLNKAKKSGVDAINSYMKTIYNLDIDAFMICDEIFDEITYTNSEFKTVQTIPTSRNSREIAELLSHDLPNQLMLSFPSGISNLKKYLEDTFGQQVKYCVR